MRAEAAFYVTMGKIEMKVLLYEPGRTGHRPVILRYLAEGLPAYGICPEVLTDDQFCLLNYKDIDDLRKYAVARGCDAVHILSIDGAARRWSKPWPPLLSRSVPLFGSYYLYNNLRGIKGLLWLWANWIGYFDHLFVSDPFLHRRSLIPGLRGLISYVPDPWKASEFSPIRKVEARTQVGLPRNEFLFLVFGQISIRKGIGRILNAMRRLPEVNAKLVLAGSILPDAVHEVARARDDRTLMNKLIIRDGSVPEEEVSAYFHAADALLSDYPRNFMVSSGAFTRALASGIVPIVPSHGVIAETVRQIEFGFLYDSESEDSLLGAMQRSIRQNAKSLGNSSRMRALDEAKRREAAIYVKSIAARYGQLADCNL